MTEILGPQRTEVAFADIEYHLPRVLSAGFASVTVEFVMVLGESSPRPERVYFTTELQYRYQCDGKWLFDRNDSFGEDADGTELHDDKWDSYPPSEFARYKHLAYALFEPTVADAELSLSRTAFLQEGIDRKTTEIKTLEELKRA